MVLCSPETQQFCSSLGSPLILFDQDVRDKLSEFCPEDIDVLGTPDDPAYCIFTSGSTGAPKGVETLHYQALSGLESQVAAGLYPRGSRLLQCASYSFDTYVGDIFGSLLVGGCICTPSENDRLTNMAKCIEKFEADAIHLTPAVAQILDPDQKELKDLRVLRSGGDSMTNKLANKWAKCVNLQNTYGPSECCVTCTLADSIRHDHDPRSIGKGFGCITWVVNPDNHRFLAPVGTVGELAIQGPAVAEGYIGNACATEKVFLKAAPWLKTYGLSKQFRTYMTGDLVCYDEEGSLLFMGRKDGQLKIRGQRVEVGEIETVIAEDEDIDNAVVCFPMTGRHREQLSSCDRALQARQRHKSLKHDAKIDCQLRCWQQEAHHR